MGFCCSLRAIWQWGCPGATCCPFSNRGFEHVLAVAELESAGCFPLCCHGNRFVAESLDHLSGGRVEFADWTFVDFWLYFLPTFGQVVATWQS